MIGETRTLWNPLNLSSLGHGRYDDWRAQADDTGAQVAG